MQYGTLCQHRGEGEKGEVPQDENGHCVFGQIGRSTFLLHRGSTAHPSRELYSLLNELLLQCRIFWEV